MNVRIFWVRAMKCMYAQTRPRFILSSEGVFLGMEFEPMLTPREKSPLPKKSPEEDRTRDAVDSEPKHYQLSYSGPFCGNVLKDCMGAGIAQSVVCWARCPVWCSVAGLNLLWVSSRGDFPHGVNMVSDSFPSETLSALGLMSFLMQHGGFDPPVGRIFLVEGVFPLEITWALTPFPPNSFRWELNRGLDCAHMHSIARIQKILTFMS